MATPQAITRDGVTHYRVQIRRPTRGIHIDERFRTKRAADAFIRNIERAIDAGEPIVQNTQRGSGTFGDLVEAYLADPQAMKTAKGRRLKPSYERDRTERVKWLARECFGGVHLKRLTWEVIRDALDSKQTEREWSSRTRYQYEVALSRLLDYGRRRGMVSANVVAGQDRLNDTGKRERIYTDAEWQKLLEAADDQGGMLGMFLRLAWETGARKSELLNLRWVDVTDVDHAQLGARLEFRDTKNHEHRVAFISKALRPLLDAHEQRFRRDDSPLVFPSRNRKPASRYKVDGPFSAARDAAGLSAPDERYGEVLSLHHVRHSWASRLGDNGATLAQLMTAGGWRTPAMAMRYMKGKEAQAAEAALLLVR